MEFVDCDICQSKENKLLFKACDYMVGGEEEFQIVQCKKCGLIYLNPRPQKNEIENYYPLESYWRGEAIRTDQRMKESAKESLTKLKKTLSDYFEVFSELERLIPAKGKILDIGCGTGEFLSVWKKWGWECLGVELFSVAADYAKKVYDLNVINADVLEAQLPPNYFDLATLNGVLEHTFHPSKVLEKVAGTLKSGGICLVYVQNIESWGAKIFKNYWYGIDPPRHLYHFSPLTLRQIMRQCGFHIDKIANFSKALNPFIIKESIVYWLKYHKGKKKVRRMDIEASEKGINFEKDWLVYAKRLAHKCLETFCIPLAWLGSWWGRGESICAYGIKL